jgi:hypothetical protein
MRDLRKALGDVYSDHKSESESSTPAASPKPLDEDLAQALSAALADVPSVERLQQPPAVAAPAPKPTGPPRVAKPSQPSPFAFNLTEDLPELELVDPEPEITLDFEPEVEPEVEVETPEFEMVEPQPAPEPEIQLETEVMPSAPRPTPKMAAWLKGDMPGATDMTEAVDDGLPMPAQVWQVSDDDILPARSGGGRRRRR